MRPGGSCRRASVILTVASWRSRSSTPHDSSLIGPCGQRGGFQVPSPSPRAALASSACTSSRLVSELVLTRPQQHLVREMSVVGWAARDDRYGHCATSWTHRSRREGGVQRDRERSRSGHENSRRPLSKIPSLTKWTNNTRAQLPLAHTTSCRHYRHCRRHCREPRSARPAARLDECNGELAADI